MPVFELVLEDASGERHSLFYDNHTSSLTNEAGEDFFTADQFKEVAYTVSPVVSPDAPAPKVSNPARIKIQFGLRCNYSCPYCLQAASLHGGEGERTSIHDAEEFIKNLDNWLIGSPNTIELWGGEPFIYWKKIRYLLPLLAAKFPEVEFLIVTNGSLLTDEIIDAIVEYDINVGISHDGPGQHVRGPNPLENPQTMDAIKRLIAMRPGKVAFNSVLTADSYDIDAIIAFFEARFGPEVSINFEGVVASYEGENGVGAVKPFSAEQYRELIQNVSLGIAYGSALRINSIRSSIAEFIKSITTRRPAWSLGQGCGMDRPNQIAVDLKGNVMTCQNVGAIGRHNLGNVSSLEDVRLTTATHWSHRAECPSCPVLQLCGGSCMYIDGKNWEITCNNEYHYRLGVLGGIMSLMTGCVMREVKGEIIRP